MDGLNLLKQAHAAGLRVTAKGARLVIHGPHRAEAMARLLIEHKPDIMAVLAKAAPPVAENSTDWRELYEGRAAIRQFDAGYSKASAERLAFGECIERWCEQHPQPVDRRFCAGCGHMLGGDALDLADGTRVHFEPHREFGCLIAYGMARKRRAVMALAALGLTPPKSWE
jgi:hypothetical protein